MTGPQNSSTNRSGERTYVWPSKPPYELEVPSVTTIIGGGIPKDALPRWAAKMVAEYAVRHKAAWEQLPIEDAVHLLKGSPYRYTNKKARIGTVVHNAVEAHTNGDDAHELEEHEQGYYNAALGFFGDYSPEPLHVEATVYSRKYGFAGTSDLFCNLRLPGESKALPTITDYKTGKAIYPEYGVQLCTYSRGDFIAGDDDEEIDLPKCKRGVSVRLMPDGKYEARKFDFTDDLFKIFLAAKVVADRERVCRNAMSRPLKFTKSAT